MKRKYLSAAKVLPSDLLAQLQRYAAGSYLWVSTTRKAEIRRRDRRIARLYFEKGLSTEKIARKVYLTLRRVRQILGEWRRKNSKSE